MTIRINLSEYIKEMSNLIKKYLELVPSLFFIPIIVSGLTSGKKELIINFIIIYIFLEIIIRLFSKLLAMKRLKDASKVIRVIELNEKGSANYQIADTLEKEGYSSIFGRRILTRSIAKIIENGNRGKALETKQLELTELSHRISKSLLGLLIRSIVVGIFIAIILIPNANIAIEELNPEVSSPQEIGTRINWYTKINNKGNNEFDYSILIDNNEIKSGKRSGDISWTWDTENYKSGNHKIEVIIWIDDNLKDKKTYNFELYNEKPEIESISYYFYQQGKKDTNNTAPIGTVVYFKVRATDPEDDELTYIFSVDGEGKTLPQDSKNWDWDTSATYEGNHEIGVTVDDGKEHADNLDVNDKISYTIKPITMILQSRTTRLYEPIEIGTVVKLKSHIRENIIRDSMQYRFYIDDHAATKWQESNEYLWNTTNIAEGYHEIRAKMRFDKKSVDTDCDAETEPLGVLMKTASL